MAQMRKRTRRHWLFACVLLCVGRCAFLATTEVRRAGGAQRRFFLGESGGELSPWHDLPLRSSAGDFWMVTEIPKMTRAKMEMMRGEAFNPIGQDTKGGALREYHGPIFWNYGFLPQTWEDPTAEHRELKVFGDNDPLDVVEIGSRARGEGEVLEVKALGSLAMIDSGELDWKVIAVAKDDPLAERLQDIVDVEAELPGVVSGIREWFRWYKTPDGKGLNGFGFQERPQDRATSLGVIEEGHAAWKKLMAEGADGIWRGETGERWP